MNFILFCRISLPYPNSNITQVPSTPSKDKRKAQVLAKHLPSHSISRSDNRRGGGGTRNVTTQQDSAKKNPSTVTMTDNSSSNPASTLATNSMTNYSKLENKENCAMKLTTASGQSRAIGPLPLQEQVKQSTARETNNARTDEANHGIALNGSKSCCDSSNRNAYQIAAMTKTESQLSITTMKVPIDPPGAILGAIPFSHYSTGQQQYIVSTAEIITANPIDNHVNGGGADQPIFHPLPSMNNWGYHAIHHHQSHLNYHQHGTSSNDDNNPSQQWVMPYFLAPFTSTVCPPCSNLKTGDPDPNTSRTTNGDTIHHSINTHEDHNTSAEKFIWTDGVPSSDADDTMSTNESMASSKDDSNEVETIDTKFIPSTFAPSECVEKIRAKHKAAAIKHDVVLPRQTRSMSRRQRRDSSRSSSSKQSSRSIAVAHQACSPRTTIAPGSACGAKVAANTPISDKNSSAPQVMTVLGKRVVMIDPARKVFIIDLLSPAVCDQIRMMADDHTREIHKSGSDAETWRTLYTYTKMDLPVAEVNEMTKKYTEQILLDIKKIVGEIFGGDMRKEAMNLKPRYEYALMIVSSDKLRFNLIHLRP